MKLFHQCISLQLIFLLPMNYLRDFSGPRHVKIGNDVWIGYRAVIINSVTIGHGAVIGAYAVVREDVPPYAIVIGNPAKVIRYRFNETQIRILLEIAWWEWSDEEILFHMPRRDDFEAFVEYNRTRLFGQSGEKVTKDGESMMMLEAAEDVEVTASSKDTERNMFQWRLNGERLVLVSFMVSLLISLVPNSGVFVRDVKTLRVLCKRTYLQ